MSRTQATPPRAAAAEPRRTLSRGDNPLVRAVGRLPATVHTKLFVAFVGTAVLVVAVGLLGLRVLGQSNDRVGRLGALQQRASAYGKLQSDANNVRLLLAENVDPAFFEVNPLEGPVPTAESAVRVDKAVVNALARIGATTVADRLGFVPSAEDVDLLRQIRATSGQLSTLMGEIIDAEVSGAPVPRSLRARSEQLAITLNHLAIDLADDTTAKTDDLIALNASAYERSRNLFIGVAAGAIVLALLLGFVLSWSLIGPIQRIDARLAAIAGGDFSEHVDVDNRDELGALGGNVNRMNDELRRVYSELETVSRHKSEFLANTSHELRTPLNAIIGYSELLLQQSFGPLNERQTGYVDDVLDSGRHLLSLINDILDLSKVEAGKMELELGDVSLRQALESGLAMHAEAAKRAGITLGLTLQPEEITIRADERKLRQIVFNLLSNAIKFTPPDGRVDVVAELSGEVVKIAVSDTGPGIDPDDQELIFEEFRQAGSGSAQGARHDGTGLGLPLSRGFVELHGGRLWVESAEDSGSTFRFVLPVGQAG